jgi:Flp pilus assembly protein TadG
MPEVEMAIVLTVILVVLGGVLDGAAVVKDMEII